ncbi:hypothetical protein [Acidimangrovimonas pyrenivorans]|uniref:Uncharacterized protein n=1 Tax=Acidimangrovimonas pyrenivorans TaxID=2030798 RepID=A0ABV7AFR9_9RHOB
MALRSDAAMVLFYDIDGDTADHDDWHSHEHFHERLSVPGFLRATRWIATAAEPRYMVTYEVSDTAIGTSQPYLDRLNDPTAWTGAIMPRFRGMTRGFCHVTASAGFGLGAAAVALRFQPSAGSAAELSGWLADVALPAMVELRGIAGAHLLQPVPPPPMTREQALRGADRPMPWLIFATGYDAAALDAAVAADLAPEALAAKGAEELIHGRYALHYTADADEVARTPKPPVLSPEGRKRP